MNFFELKNQSDFELAHIFECGQCFRWNKNVSGNVEICTNIDDFSIVSEYLDLGTDYSKIKKILSENDENIREALKYGSGIRILNQDPWEMLISFIISAANNIPRISKTIENISRTYGKKVVFDEKEFYLFPTPDELSKASKDDLRALGLGFRDKYIYGATKLVLDGQIDLKHISELPYKEAKKCLTSIPGVGEKVADCILLFSMKKKEAFPVDTWIKKVMGELYVDSHNVKKISEFAKSKFGKYAGIAQQYLFYWRRTV